MRASVFALLAAGCVGLVTSRDDAGASAGGSATGSMSGGSTSGGTAGGSTSGGTAGGSTSGGSTNGGSTSGGAAGGGSAGGSVARDGGATIAWRVAIESRAGMDGCIAWQSVFLLNDGRIASFGTGNHAPEQSNAVRIIDPVTVPGQVTTSDAFPWTQQNSPPNMTTGSNRYVSNYDNHPSIYLPPVNKAVWAGHGIFDFATNAWTHGDRPPLTQPWSAFVADPRTGMSSTYNPAVAWCASLGVGVWFGASHGGYGRTPTEISIIEPSDGGTPWTTSVSSITGIDGLHAARNSAVCLGDSLFVWGPVEASPGQHRFYELNVRLRTLSAVLPTPINDQEDFPQLVHDPVRNRLVLIGKRLQTFSLATRTWTDLTPSGWPGFGNVSGVYHPTLDAIFFRGVPPTLADCFDWNRVTF